jgi:hypothetical protein
MGAKTVGKIIWDALPEDDGFARVFGLKDDPFSPTSVSQVTDKSLLTELYKRPIRMDLDRGLDDLFVPEAGPFLGYLERFGRLLGLAGYRRDPVQTRRPFAFVVSGEEGTGKSTLVSAFVRWLSECKKVTWIRRDYPPPGIAPAERPGLYQYLSSELNGVSVDDYCCLVIDNMDAAMQLEAIQLYQDFSSNRALIMFLITKNLELLHEAGPSHPVDFRRFRMQPLTPEQTVIFVKRRIDLFRIGAHIEQLRDYELFPFLAEDLRRVVAEKDGQFREGPVTLRVLASILHELMESRLIGDGPDIELASLSRDQLHDYLIFLRPAYGELVVA